MPSSHTYQNVLCIRADNMGDVIMSSPAMRALKTTFDCRITLLTSQAGSLIAPHLDCVDALIVRDLPWVKTMAGATTDLQKFAVEIAAYNFDAVVIFTVYSQSALPAAMLAYMAGIPVRVAYARENPYDLLTTWLPDREPYAQILHQVERDLQLAQAMGAAVDNVRFDLRTDSIHAEGAYEKLFALGVNMHAPFLVLHPGVSEEKRKYPVEMWIEAGRLLASACNMPLLISGAGSEADTGAAIARGIGDNAYNAAGRLALGEFIDVIKCAACVISVNTGTIHIAAAVQTPVVVLYAQTNPQHTPWQSPHRILPFSVPERLQSQNPVIRHVAGQIYREKLAYPTPEMIVDAVAKYVVHRSDGTF